MKIATVPSKNRKQLIIVVTLLLGIPLVLFASLEVAQWVTRASVEPEPTNVLFTNVGTQEFTVSWVTDTTSTGSVIPIVNGQDGAPLIDTRGSRKRKTHYVTQRALEPNTNYSFTILSNEERYGSDGLETFSFKTPTVVSTAPTANPVSGSVSGVNNEDGMVFISTMDKDVYAVSSVVSKGGTWNIDLSSLRKISDGSYIIVRENDRLVIVAVVAPDKGAFLQGTFGELFDSNGVLKEVYPLNVGDIDDPYSKLFVSEGSTPFISTPVTPSLETSDAETSDSSDAYQPVEQSRRFRIVTHVEWIDMTTVEGLADVGGIREESVRIVNAMDTGFTVIWLSRQKELGYIKYGTSKDSLTNEASDERDGITSKREYYVHYVPVTRLQPDMEYYFEIYSGKEVYTNQGQKYIAKTFPRLTTPPPFNSVAGKVSGIPDHGEAVIIMHIQDVDNVGSLGRSADIASLVDQRSNWILSISDSRTEDGLEYFEYTSEDSVNFDVVTTASTETHKEQAQGIGSRDIEVLLEGKSVLGVESSEIGLLSNYGIWGYSTGIHLQATSTGSSGQNYQVTYESGTQIPKTGVSDNIIYIVILSIVLVVTPFTIYIIHMTKKRRKGTMIKSL